MRGVWERNILTNQGPLVRELEARLQSYHGLNGPVYCVANGALGLHLLIKSLGLSGEVVTTPFSYVATTACPIWEGCTVKFADIEADHLTLDPRAVEAMITPRTEAIIATHVFGNPCNVEIMDEIARKHGLALIYDAAHAFGVKYKGNSVLNWGDASMVSMHATKLFHSVEGGFLVVRDREIASKVEWMRRFAHDGPERFHGIGTNAKLSEPHAAMGLCVLPHLPQIIAKRAAAVAVYDEELRQSENWPRFAFRIRLGTEWNQAYYPVCFSSETELLRVTAALVEREIYCRRYFYPLLDAVGPSVDDCPNARDVSKRILCLPLSAEGVLEARTVVAAIRTVLAR